MVIFMCLMHSSYSSLDLFKTQKTRSNGLSLLIANTAISKKQRNTQSFNSSYVSSIGKVRVGF